MPSTETKEESEKDIVEIQFDPNLKVVWVDSLHMAKREDGVCCLRLSANLPEGLCEQTKFMTNTKSLKEFVEIICSTINYYPTKERKKPIKSVKKLTSTK